ncbi:MAG TPA: molybdopterin-binding protein [Rhodospirillales bacterium]|nr:molybdopterin-binding protein [Rhodospirillales bacterium]
MGEPGTVTAAVIIIGNEVLSGRTVDANLPFLAKALNGIGVRVREARIIPDDEAVIGETINACRTAFDYVLTTGGIGPTHDDITSASIAKAFGVPLERNPQALRALEQHYRPGEFNEARRKMADVPAGASLIDNPVSKAPGFQIGNVFVLPGVPVIMRAMFDGIRDRFRGGEPMLSRSIAAYTTEGAIASGLGRIQAGHDDVEIGSYPFVRGGRFGVSLVARSTNRESLDRVADEIKTLIREVGETPIEDETG